MGELGFELISDAKSALSLKETVAVWVGGREVGAQTELQTLGVDLRVSDNLPPERRTRPGSPRMRPRQRYWALGLGQGRPGAPGRLGSKRAGLWGLGGCDKQRRQRGKGRESWHNRAQAGEGVQSPRSTAAIFQSNPGRAQRCQERPPARGARALTSLSWKGLERMVRLPSSMDFWNRAGICRPCSLS